MNAGLFGHFATCTFAMTKQPHKAAGAETKNRVESFCKKNSFNQCRIN